MSQFFSTHFSLSYNNNILLSFLFFHLGQSKWDRSKDHTTKSCCAPFLKVGIIELGYNLTINQKKFGLLEVFDHLRLPWKPWKNNVRLRTPQGIWLL